MQAHRMRQPWHISATNQIRFCQSEIKGKFCSRISSIFFQVFQCGKSVSFCCLIADSSAHPLPLRRLASRPVGRRPIWMKCARRQRPRQRRRRHRASARQRSEHVLLGSDTTRKLCRLRSRAGACALVCLFFHIYYRAASLPCKGPDRRWPMGEACHQVFIFYLLQF